MATKITSKLFRRRSQRHTDSLVELIQQRDEEAVLALLHAGRAKVNGTNKYGQTPLCAAITFLGNNKDLVAQIIDAGANINKKGNSQETPLTLAIFLKNIELVLLLVQRQANTNLPGSNENRLPLTLALQADSIETQRFMIRTLLQHGADPNLGQPLAVAIDGCYPDVMFDLLVEAGANPRKQAKVRSPHEDEGRTLLHLAARSGSVHVMTALLEEHHLHAFVNNNNNNNLVTPLMGITCRCVNIDDDIPCRHTQIANLLIQAGADVNMVSACNTSPLSHACTTGSYQLVKLYVENGAKLVQDDDNCFKHVLHRVNGPKIMKYLVDFLFESESKSVIHKLGRVAFTYAVDYGVHDILQVLLAYNPDANFWSEHHNENANSYSVQKWNPTRHNMRRPVDLLDFKTAQILLDHGLDTNAGLLEQWERFKKLPSKHQVNNHQRYQFTQTPLNVALQCSVMLRTERADRLKMANTLLYYGADCNIPGLYYTPLHALMENFGTTNLDVIDTVKMMVLCGLDIHTEQWLIDRLHPGVPLGSPELRAWLVDNVLNPQPLKQLCLIFIRKFFKGKALWKVPSLPLPTILKDYLLLKNMFVSCAHSEESMSNVDVELHNSEI